MRALPEISERSARFLIGLLLAIKLLLLAWNAVVYDGRTYDAPHHADRAVFGGLKLGTLAYDPPLYYLPTLLVPKPADVARVERDVVDDAASAGKRGKRAKIPRPEQAFRERLIDVLRYTNVLWVAVFYLAWIGYAFPRLLRDWRAWFLASLLLLALPGYQKLAAMSHPDNAFAGASALVVCAWLALRERWLDAGPGSPTTPPRAPLRAIYLLVAAVALVGLSRPLAVVYVAVFTVMALVYVWRFAARRWRLLVPHALLVVTIIGAISGGWYLARWRETGAVLTSVPAAVGEEFQPLKEEFNYARYLTSFYPRSLWETPNYNLGELPPGRHPQASHANSLVTVLHSELWGDHWLSFSGPKGRDGKVWPKRVSIMVAVAMPFVSILALVVWAVSYAQRVARYRKREVDHGSWPSAAELREPELALALLCVLGVAAFLCWQMGPALMPGHNSSIKFIYLSPFFPPAIALALSRPIERALLTPLTSYFLLLYIAAFPVAMYWPG